MSEPFFIAQNGDTKTDHEAADWFAQTALEGRRAGAKFMRFTEGCPGHPRLLLVEGWSERRVKEQGSPRFQLTDNAPSDWRGTRSMDRTGAA